jgi:hypothetical protein
MGYERQLKSLRLQ